MANLYRAGLVWLGVLQAGAACCLGQNEWLKPLWPTADTRFFSGEDYTSWGQPSASGVPETALFGCFRNNGHRFHEGLDIAPVTRDSKGEPADIVNAILPGRVAYVSSSPGSSSYGRYVIVVHEGADVPVYSLYAHLARIEPGIAPGTSVRAGQPLALMGRSAGGYTIPRERGHLHLEIGFIKSSRFQNWYVARGYGSPNEHGIYNGMNLVGMDPRSVFESVRRNTFRGFLHHIRSLPSAFTLRVSTQKVPDFLDRYPMLMTRVVDRRRVVAWRIDFTWYGLPFQWTPLYASEVLQGREGDIALERVDLDQFTTNCTRTLSFPRKDKPSLSEGFQNDLKLLFGFR